MNVLGNSLKYHKMLCAFHMTLNSYGQTLPGMFSWNQKTTRLHFTIMM